VAIRRKNGLIVVGIRDTLAHTHFLLYSRSSNVDRSPAVPIFSWRSIDSGRNRSTLMSASITK